ncbi:MAG: hypothetical protein HZB39_15030 [Planctomycetes bacterium]|nr:hypothetical protein [Planctomycetota bacterium]
MSVRARCVSISLVFATACAGPLPDPAEMAARLPDGRAIDPVRRLQLDTEVEAARTQLAKGRLTEARSIAGRVLEFDPRDGRAMAIRAHCRLAIARESDPPALDEYRAAEGELRRASALAPDDPFVALLHAGFLVADGHLTAAAERIERALVAAPNDVDLLELGGRVRFDLGDEIAAIPLLSRRVALTTGDAASVWRLAQCHARLASSATDGVERARRAEAARDAFRLHAALAPDDVESLLGEAWAALLLLGERVDSTAIEPVLALYDRAARLDPASPAPSFGRGIALARAGRDDEARAAWREALGLDSRHLPSLFELAASLSAAGDAGAARPLLRRALELGPTDDERRRIEDWLREHGGAESS